MKIKKKLIIVGGLHSTPALTLVDFLLEQPKSFQIFYIGSRFAYEGSRTESFEFLEIKKRKKVVFLDFVAGKFHRYLSLKGFLSLLKIPLGFFYAFYWLLRIKPEVIISFGGYFSVPVILVGWLLRIPTLAHEQTAVLGLATKFCLPFVRKLAVSFPSLLERNFSPKIIFTGNLIRPSIYQKNFFLKTELIDFLANVKKPVIYVTGAKTGSEFINNLVNQSLDNLLRDFAIVHQIGADRNFQPRRKANYFSLRFVSDEEIGAVFSKSLLVISRSGANIVWELIALKKPAILIPLPGTSGDEQNKNAAFLKELGLGEILFQQQATANSLISLVKKMSTRIENYKINDSFWENFDFKKSVENFYKELLGIISKEN